MKPKKGFFLDFQSSPKLLCSQDEKRIRRVTGAKLDDPKLTPLLYHQALMDPVQSGGDKLARIGEEANQSYLLDCD